MTHNLLKKKGGGIFLPSVCDKRDEHIASFFPYLSDPFQQHSNLSNMQSFSYSEQSLLLRYSCTWGEINIISLFQSLFKSGK